MDEMTSNAQKALKRIMEKYASNVRFVITTNHLHKIIEPIQSRCIVQKLKPVDKYAIRGLIFRICQSEQLEYNYDSFCTIVLPVLLQSLAKFLKVWSLL